MRTRRERRVAAACLPRLALSVSPRRAAQNIVVVIDDGDARRPFALRGVTRIADCSDDLRAQGVRPAMRVLDAQRYAPALQVEVVQRAKVQRELARTAELLWSCSPLVQAIPPSSIAIDLGGLPRSTAQLVDDVVRELAAAGHPAYVAAAPGRRLALALARDLAAAAGPRTFVVDEGGALGALARVSLPALDLSPDLQSALAALGVKTALDLKRLVPAGLSARLFDEARGALRLLEGADEEPLAPLPQTQRIEESIELEDAITTIEPLGFVLLPLCDRLCRRARARIGKVAAVELALSGRDLDEVIFSLSFPDPLGEGRALQGAVTARLEAAGVPGPVEVLRLTAIRLADGRPRQRDAFAPDDLPPAALGALLAELSTELGPQAVGCLTFRPSLVPERMTELRWPAPPAPPAEVRIDPDALTQQGRFMGGWPWPLSLLKEPVSARSLTVRRTLRFARLEGDDEADRPFTREYVVLELVDGRRALGLLDRELDELLVQGWFD